MLVVSTPTSSGSQRSRTQTQIWRASEGSLGGCGSITAAPEVPEERSPEPQTQLLHSLQNSRLVTISCWSCQRQHHRARNVARQHSTALISRRFAGRHRLLRSVGWSGVVLADQPTMALHSIPAYQQHQHSFSPAATAPISSIRSTAPTRLTPPPARFTRYARPAVARTACAVGESCHSR